MRERKLKDDTGSFMKVATNSMFIQMSEKSRIKNWRYISGRYGKSIQTDIQREHGSEASPNSHLSVHIIF